MILLFKQYFLKNFWAKFIAALVAFLFPIRGLLLGAIFFSVLDLILGTIQAIKSNTFKFNKLKIKVFYLALYMVAIIAGNVYDVIFLGNEMITAKIISSIICGVEFLSVIRHFSKLTGIPLTKKLTDFILKH